ncbi:hypothetical protein DPMN_177396 [Dreissena polymorpha]|uniref:Uncharacterized protein n=1 Tax=Dreissena polymorpha TaxID=45954 RepID=A0A9D4IIZ1_DREPO|nr:hypothetical protein DPMN_177396 [Dreissena polymorpha]
MSQRNTKSGTCPSVVYRHTTRMVYYTNVRHQRKTELSRVHIVGLAKTKRWMLQTLLHLSVAMPNSMWTRIVVKVRKSTLHRIQ